MLSQFRNAITGSRFLLLDGLVQISAGIFTFLSNRLFFCYGQDTSFHDHQTVDSITHKIVPTSYMRKSKAQTSLHIRTVFTVPLIISLYGKFSIQTFQLKNISVF